MTFYRDAYSSLKMKREEANEREEKAETKIKKTIKGDRKENEAEL